MRVTGGRARGIPLTVPKGNSTRPATDRDREALFSSLGPWIENKAVLDLFAGTGAYGLEALSRGAQTVTWVENDRKALAVLKKNLAMVEKAMGLSEPKCSVLSLDVFRPLPALTGQFDLVIMDPPYRLWESKGEELFSSGRSFLRKLSQGLIVFETPVELSFLAENLSKSRRVGKNVRIWQEFA